MNIFASLDIVVTNPIKNNKVNRFNQDWMISMHISNCQIIGIKMIIS